MLPSELAAPALAGVEHVLGTDISPEAAITAYVDTVKGLAVRLEVLRESELRHGCSDRLLYQNLLQATTTEAGGGGGLGLSHRAVQKYIEEVDKALESIEIESALAVDNTRNILGPSPTGALRRFGTSSVNEQTQVERMSDQEQQRFNLPRVDDARRWCRSPAHGAFSGR